MNCRLNSFSGLATPWHGRLARAFERKRNHAKERFALAHGRDARATILLTVLLLIGCMPKNPPRGPIGYFGPTEPMPMVLAQIRANNAPVRTLWTRHDFEATVYDESHKSHFVSGDGTLLFRKPRDLRIDGNKDIAGNIFQLGSNSEQFWAKVAAGTDTLWVGQYKNVGKPCMKEMPVRPDLIMEVLGVTDVPENLLADPAPVMRFNNDTDTYMILWLARGSTQFNPVKEIFYDRVTKLPTLVLVFGKDGRVALSAKLSKHKPIEMPSYSGQLPKIATHYELFFPETKTKLIFDLRDISIMHNGVPADRSFRFPAPPEGFKVEHVDEDCGP
jgi:hypothetical protein